jgi:hypothetical protein
MRTRRIALSIDESESGAWRLTATISEPWLRGKKTVWRASRTRTVTLSHPYASQLTTALMDELAVAATLVAAGFYEQPALPF